MNPNLDISSHYQCSSAEPGVVVNVDDKGAALVFTDNDADNANDIATVTMAIWRGEDANESAVAENETLVVSDVMTIYVTGTNKSNIIDAVNIDDTIVTVALEVISSSTSKTVRKSASCRYLDENRDVWVERGMFMRGMTIEFDQGQGISSIMCVSTHLTTMAIVDKSSLERIVENKVNILASRVEQMFSAEMDPKTNKLNWFVIGIFVGVSFFFMVIIFVTKLSGRKNAVLVGREVFVQHGGLFRPSVVGAAGSEAILRGWMSAKEVMLLSFLHIVSTNPFIGIFFHWSHSDIVFSRADKATGLFAGLLLTFISTGLLVDLDGSNESGIDMILEIFVSAVLTQVLLLPFKHALPYMISNINSISSNTHQSIGLLKRQIDKVRNCFCCSSQKLRHKKDVQVTVLDKWMSLVAETHVASERILNQNIDNVSNFTCNKFGTQSEYFHKVSTLQESIDLHREKTQDLHQQIKQKLRKQYLKPQFFIFNCRLKLPNIGRMKRDATQLSTEKARSMQLDRISGNILPLITRWQQGVRQSLRKQTLIRQKEFSTWYNILKPARNALAWFTVIQLLLILAISLFVCLTFSYTFSEQECWAWLIAVGKSVLMQLFVTDPALGTVTFVLKMLIGWLLLRCEIRAKWRQRVKMLGRKKRSLALNERNSVVELQLLDAKLDSLQLVADGDKELVQVERKKNKAEKVRVEKKLVDVGKSIEAARVNGLKVGMHDLEKKERGFSIKLLMIQAVLEMLDVDTSHVNDRLVKIQQERGQVKIKINNIKQKKKWLNKQQERLNETIIKNTMKKKRLA